MTAASFWSLLLPALEITEQQLDAEHNNKFLALFPVLIGFFFGAGFVYFTDLILPENVNIFNFGPS
jgi:zinc transporter ZupT